MAPIKDKYTIHSKAIICQDVELKGEITIGPSTIIHPKASIFAISGPILIGSSTIIEEGAILVNRRRAPMHIGHSNLIEIGARVECSYMGDGNTIGTKARVHHTVRLGNYCVVGPKCLVAPAEDEEVEDYTVFWGPEGERSTWSGRGKVQEADLRSKHVEYLKEMLPKFNRQRKGDAS
ncbi:trimeric [Pyrrhoderma noxium]|uniref:Dynactin subunit 6 n=1 Tax=Pyrrhoderma noxium TaxID=2282107 RepID=A0A286U6D7_9AGAM|nr:trimeric [Pyrrhoderma noxium]